MVALYALFLIGLASATPLPATSLESLGSRDALTSRDAGGGTCQGPDFVTVNLVGGPPPSQCESDWGKGYVPITSITFWSNLITITGFQATYSDGTVTPVRGTKSSQVTSLTINYGQGDKFVTASLYGSNDTSPSGVYTVQLATIKGGSLTAGQAPNAYLLKEQDPGIGILFGIEYSLNFYGALQSLGFVFLEPPITEIEITDVQFPNGPVGASDNIFPRTVGKAHFYNNASSPQTYSFNNQVMMQQTYTFMQAFALTFGVMEAINFAFTFDILMIAHIMVGSTTTFNWQAMETTTLSAAFAYSQQVQYNIMTTLDPKKGVDCLAIVGQGAGTFFYTSLVTLSLKNGNSYTFPENGYLTVQAVSEGIATCTDADHP